MIILSVEFANPSMASTVLPVTGAALAAPKVSVAKSKLITARTHPKTYFFCFIQVSICRDYRALCMTVLHIVSGAAT